MAAPYHNLLSKNDRALVAYLIVQTAGTAADVFQAKYSGTKPAPCTLCWSQKATPIGKVTGTFAIETTVMVKAVGPADAGENANAPRLASELRVAKTFDALHLGIDSSGEVLAAAITAAGRALAVSDPTNHADMVNYTCIDVVIEGVECGKEEAASDVWVDYINLTMIACPSDVS